LGGGGKSERREKRRRTADDEGCVRNELAFAVADVIDVLEQEVALHAARYLLHNLALVASLSHGVLVEHYVVLWSAVGVVPTRDSGCFT